MKNTDVESIKNKFTVSGAMDMLNSIPSSSIDLIFTSPPYNLKNSTGNGMKDGRGGKWSSAALLNGYSSHSDNMPHKEYVEWQHDCLKQMYRVIKDDGAIFYNHKWRVQGGVLQDRQDIIRDMPVRQIIIWKRKGGINFNPGYFLPTYEVIYLIAKPKFKLAPKANALGDVWEIAQERKNAHPAPFPLDLAKRVISSTDAKLVLDPFCGSGTVGIAAKIHNRDFICSDASEVYVSMSKKRLTEYLKSKYDQVEKEIRVSD